MYFRQQHRILVVAGSARDDTRSLGELARRLLEAEGMDVTMASLAHPATFDDHWASAHGVIIIAPAYRHQEFSLAALSHLEPPRWGAAYGVVVHGPARASDATRKALTAWLDDIGMVDASPFARLDCHAGYNDPCADDHHDPREEVRNVAQAVSSCVTELRAGRLSQPRVSASGYFL